MDEIDLKLVEILTKNSRTSFRKIAQNLKISTDTVMRRYIKLQKEGVIRGSTIILNPKKIGYQATVVLQINIAHSNTSNSGFDSNQLLEMLIKLPNIIVASKSVGDFDLIAIGVVKDFEHLINVKNEIAQFPGVKDIQASFWVEKSELCSKYFII